MSITISATPSTNVNDTSNTTIWTDDLFNSTISSQINTITNTLTINKNQFHTLANPRALPTFEDKAKVLKENVKTIFDEKFIKLPNGLYQLLKRWCVLSGSSISSIYHGETPKDFDLWCKDADLLPHIVKTIKQNYSDEIMRYDEMDSYGTLLPADKQHQKVITENAITLIGKIQFITLGTYQEQRKMFDFVHCLPYYDLENDKFFISSQQMDSIASKKLVRNAGGKNPPTWRVDKFESRGWHI